MNKLKRNKTLILTTLLLLTLTLNILQVTIPHQPSFHNGWMVSSGDKIQYSVAYKTTTAVNSIVDSFITDLNLSTMKPIKFILSNPIVPPENLTEIATHILRFTGTIDLFIESDEEYINVSDLLLPIAIPIVNWDSLIDEFKHYQDEYAIMTVYYSFFEKHLALNFTRESADVTTTFVFVWSTDFGILEHFYCIARTQTASETLLLEETRRTLNYKNELKGNFFYVLDYGFFVVPSTVNFLLILLLFSQMDYGKKGIFRHLNLEKWTFLKTDESKNKSLTKYILLFLLFICISLSYGFLLRPIFIVLPEYKYIPMFGLQLVFPLILGLILSMYEINALNLLKEEGVIVIIYPCYAYITGMTISDLVRSSWNNLTVPLLFFVSLFVAVAYHINKLKQKTK